MEHSLRRSIGFRMRISTTRIEPNQEEFGYVRKRDESRFGFIPFDFIKKVGVQYVRSTDGNVTIPMVANSKGYVTATWVSGTSGYRKWSDGYIEQWGQTSTGKTVSLHTAFSNSNYAVLGTRTTTTGSEVSLCFYSRTTTSFYANSVWVGSGYSNTSCTWFASGY